MFYLKSTVMICAEKDVASYIHSMSAYCIYFVISEYIDLSTLIQTETGHYGVKLSSSNLLLKYIHYL